MRVARRSFLVSTMASVAAPAILRSAFADAPQFGFKLHHAFSAVSSVHDKFLVPWARQVVAQSGGRIRIDIFPSMQLGGSPAQLFDQARDGIADIVWTAPNATPGRFPKIEAFELPFVPSRRALVSSKAIEDFGRANLLDEFREVQPICFSCADRGVVHTNRPVHTAEDMKGLRLHVQTRFAGEALRALGAVPVPMPAAQLPQALTQHMVDGCVDPWNMVPALRLNDLLKAHTDFADSSLSTATFVLVMNKAAYDGMPRDLKTVIDANSGQSAAGMAGTMWDLQAASVADMAVERGDPITTLLPEAEAHWRKTTEPVVDVWLKEMKERKVDGGKLLAAAHTLLAKYAGVPEPQPVQPPQPEQVAEPAQPTQPPADAKPELTPAPKVQVSAPVAKPVAPAAPPLKPAPPMAPTASVAPPAPAPTPAPVKPIAAPAHPVAPPPAKPVPATASAAPAVTPAPVAAPPVAAITAPPPPAPPPKTLDIPL
jgi:TRAP-type transport system periplasmic protein